MMMVGIQVITVQQTEDETYVTWNWKASQLFFYNTKTADLASIINPNVNAGFSMARWVGQEQEGRRWLMDLEEHLSLHL